MDRSSEIAAAGRSARDVLEEKHRAREVTLAAGRKAIQASAAAIRAVHRGELDRARDLVGEARDRLAEADGAVADHPDVRYSGFLHDARKEYVEASLTLAFTAGEPVPAAGELGAEAPAYLNGMAEAASELRRDVLDCLRHDRLERAEELLGVMDDVYSVLVTVDYPDALTGGLRRATDALRAVLERTRGDLTTTMVAQRLRATIEAARAEVEQQVE
ncbi:MAG: haloacid dehalogenase [Acidimicrobiia bacterium]|nr:haloacid dehalogenase [Acidimicrobiia bacterium]